MNTNSYYRHNEMNRLKALILDGQSARVTGIHGIGKTKLVKNCLDDLRIDYRYLDGRKLIAKNSSPFIAMVSLFNKEEIPNEWSAIEKWEGHSGGNEFYVFDEMHVFKSADVFRFHELTDQLPKGVGLITISSDLSNDNRGDSGSKNYLNKILLYPFSVIETIEILRINKVDNIDFWSSVCAGNPTIIKGILTLSEYGMEMKVGKLKSEFSEYFQSIFNKFTELEITAAKVFIANKHSGRKIDYLKFRLIERYIRYNSAIGSDVNGCIISPLFESWLIDVVDLSNRQSKGDSWLGGILPFSKERLKEVNEILKEIGRTKSLLKDWI
jgi:hypothetical protein